MSESDPTPIQKCERCHEVESLAEGYRIAVVEAAKLLEFVLDPSTTEAMRAEIRKLAFGGVSEALSDLVKPTTPPTDSESSKTGLA